MFKKNRKWKYFRTYDDKLASTELRGLAQWLLLEIFVQKVFETNLNLS